MKRAVPLLLIVGGAILLAAAGGFEIVQETRLWLARGGPAPSSLMMHVLVVAAALLLLAAMVLNRRAAQRALAAESALRESEERLRLVANNVPALISYVDREQRYRFSNRTYDDWFGIAHEEMQGRTVAEVFGEEAYGRMRENIERCLAGAGVEFEFTTAEGGKQIGRASCRERVLNYGDGA